MATHELVYGQIAPGLVPIRHRLPSLLVEVISAQKVALGVGGYVRNVFYRCVSVILTRIVAVTQPRGPLPGNIAGRAESDLCAHVARDLGVKRDVSAPQGCLELRGGCAIGNAPGANVVPQVTSD